jgi:hypothetical protein
MRREYCVRHGIAVTTRLLAWHAFEIEASAVPVAYKKVHHASAGFVPVLGNGRRMESLWSVVEAISVIHECSSPGPRPSAGI